MSQRDETAGRVVRFAANHSLGTLRIQSGGASPVTLPALGEVDVPPGAVVSLQLAPDADPVALGELPADLFTVVTTAGGFDDRLATALSRQVGLAGLVAVGDVVQAEIAELDERVQLERYAAHGEPLTDVGATVLGRLSELSTLILNAPSVRDGGFSALAGLTGLRKLTLLSGGLGDDALAALAGLPALAQLTLGSTEKITARGWSALSRFSSLTNLTLPTTALPPPGVVALARLESLVGVHVRSIATDPASVAALAGVRSLENVHVADATDSELLIMRRALPGRTVNDVCYSAAALAKLDRQPVAG